MATVTITQVVLCPVSNPSALLLVEASSVEESDGMEGSVKTYAGGRRRSVQRVGQVQTVTIGFDLYSRADLATLRSWLGQVVLYRDPRGRRVFGVFYTLPLSENIAADIVSVKLVLERVTYDEAV